MSKTKLSAGALGVTALASAAATAATLFLFAGPRARRRRALAVDKVHHLEKLAAIGADRAARDLAHRAQGVAARRRDARLRAELVSERLDRVDDGVLVARARSAIGHVCTHPHAVVVEPDHTGGVILRGDVLESERGDVVRAARKVHGIGAVFDDLAAHDVDDAASVPALQGGRASAPELWRRSWSPATRLAASFAGGLLIAGAWISRRWFATAVLGAGLVARAASNRSVVDWTGPFSVKKSITIRATPDEVFAIFGHVEAFPRFMAHVHDVHQLDADRWRWRVEGPFGPLSSTCEIVRWSPGDSIAWRSPALHGEARFVPAEQGTRLDCELTFARGAAGALVLLGKLVGRDVKRFLDDDLLRLKSLLENKKAGGVAINDVLSGAA